MVQEFIERKIQLFFKQNEACQHLAEILGIGVLSAMELVATVDDANQFQSGRHLVAYLGLVPRQWSSGGKTNLCGISKRGDAYLRKLLIYGARSLLRDQGFAIGSMSVQIEGAVDGPTQAEEGCCGGDDEQKCTGVARVLLLYDEAFKHDYASGHKKRVLAGV